MAVPAAKRLQCAWVPANHADAVVDYVSMALKLRYTGILCCRQALKVTME